MKLLILGGTVFLGRHIVEAALAGGHSVTLFNRGQHNPDLFPEVERIRGDRTGDLEGLRGRSWDAVIDTCGYLPRVVQKSAELLAPAVEHYTFISSVSVYGNISQPGLDETAPVGRLDDPTVEVIDGETYGPLKALCEEVVEQALPGRSLIIRPGLIVGPNDPTDRFTYWPYRIAQGGEVLAPGRPEAGVQFIDVRDLAAWIVRMVEERRAGIYNAVGPDEPLPLGYVLQTCMAVSGSDAQVTWVSERFLLDAGVTPWSELPVWVPRDETSEHEGLFTVDARKAQAVGLRYRPLEDIVQATLTWARTELPGRELRAGLSREREQELLRSWHEQQTPASV